MDKATERIAEDFLRRYESAWADGAETVAEQYTSDGVLVGYFTAIGRSEILKLVQGIIGQGWTQIKIKAVNVRRIGDVVLVANEYTALGSGTNAGKTFNATASHVLAYADGAWRSTLHTAR
jgi:uncharacterized protein (TIGR02246 family)